MSPAAVILRSPAPTAASPSPLHASSPAPAVAINSLGHAYSVSSPAPAPSPQFYRAAPSPQQQRSGSLSSTPVASPINYPPGPGPGNNLTQNQPVQLPAGTITIPGLTSNSPPLLYCIFLSVQLIHVENSLITVIIIQWFVLQILEESKIIIYLQGFRFFLSVLLSAYLKKKTSKDAVMIPY